MLSCREATRLIARSMEAPLTPTQRIALAFHLVMCRFCRQYRKQLQWLDRAIEEHLATSE